MFNFKYFFSRFQFKIKIFNLNYKLYVNLKKSLLRFAPFDLNLPLEAKNGYLPRSINTKFVCSSSTVYKSCGYANYPNNASTINPIPDCFLTALKIHIDDVLI